MRTSFVIVLMVASTAAAAAEGVRFTSPPAAKADGAGLRIDFAVSAATDVEVAVLNAKGQVVRHLAAGVIGAERAVPPLKPNSLSQSILWDRTDDAGEAAGGPVNVRVRAGMAAGFGRIIGASPYVGQATSTPYRGSVQGVAVDDKGNLYVKMMSDVRSHGNTGLWPFQLRKFGPGGKYVKTLLPYPPSTGPAKASGIKLIPTGPDGPFTPVNQNSLYPVFHVFGSEIHQRVRPDGSVVFINTQGRELNFFKTDGSNTLRTVKMWPPGAKLNCPSWLDAAVAFSPDGRYAYYSNVAGTVYDGKKPEDVDPKWPNGRVYRHDLSQADSTPEPFFDLTLPDFSKKKYWMPSAWDKRTAAAGVDTDPQGTLYVGDLVNQQIVLVSPEGKQTGAIKIPWPDRVQVHPKTGDLYVVSRVVSRGYRPPDKLLKITGRGDSAKVVAELAMRTRGNMEFALDLRGEAPVLWVLAPGKGPSGQALLRVEDRGTEFVVTRDIFDRDPNAIAFVGNLNVDHETNTVYVTNTSSKAWRYDGATGKGGPIKVGASDLAVGGGRLYRIVGWHSKISRFTRGLEPIPLGEGGGNEFGSFYGRAGRGCSVGGLAVDRRGRLWVLQEGAGMFVKAYTPDGAPVPFERSVTAGRPPEKIPAAITGFDIRAGCIRVDRQGNLYVGWGHLPKDHKPPPGYQKDTAYRVATGAVLKFAPTGGHKVTVPKGQKPPDSVVMGFEGVLDVYPGLAPFSAWRCAGSCICCKPRFDLDEFARLFIPNAITFSVAVVDNAGNPIVRFGHYGNFDAQGPGSAEPKPEIPLGWPIGAGVSGDHVYVGDVLNHRIVRVDLRYAAEETVPAK